MWIPDLVRYLTYFILVNFQAGTHKDLMATSGEFLRIWEVGEESRSVKLKSKLSNVSITFSK